MAPRRETKKRLGKKHRQASTRPKMGKTAPRGTATTGAVSPKKRKEMAAKKAEAAKKAKIADEEPGAGAQGGGAQSRGSGQSRAWRRRDAKARGAGMRWMRRVRARA